MPFVRYDRHDPRSKQEEKAAHARVISRCFISPPNLTLTAPDVTALERKTIQRLRNLGNWWEGDANALQVLRQYAAEISTSVNPDSPMSTQKIAVSAAADIIKKNQVEPALARRIIEEMNIATQGDAEPKPPAVKKQSVILVSDPEGRMPTCDLVGWVVQIPESESPATTLDRIFQSAYDFNVTKKGRLLPVKSVGEAIENVGARFFKDYELWVKTKVPVLVVRTDNQIPREVSVKEVAA